jgi:RimJ/RimL family protein N-acetyltransferase
MTTKKYRIEILKREDSKEAYDFCTREGEGHLLSHKILIAEGKGYSWIAKDDSGNIVGFTGFYPDKNTFHSCTVVGYGWRRSGMGTIFMKLKLNTAKKLHFRNFIAEVSANNVSSIMLMHKMGFYFHHLNVDVSKRKTILVLYKRLKLFTTDDIPDDWILVKEEVN